MEKVKELIRKNKKLVGIILAMLLTVAGVKLAPETTEQIVDAVVEVCCSETPAPAQPPVEPAP